MKFRKKPVVIDAIVFDGKNIAEVCAFAPSSKPWTVAMRTDGDPTVRPTAYYPRVLIETLEGNVWASPGDWIIRGVKGECYPCKPDIFEATYERTEGAHE